MRRKALAGALGALLLSASTATATTTVPPAAPVTPASQTLPAKGVTTLAAPLRVNAMWIWQLPRAQGGDLAAIALRARAAGFGAVYLKSADGGDAIAQFTPDVVATLKAQGLRVCAWQFVYGRRPIAEARAGAAAVAAGADCLVIDAESTYEGRYWAARRYMAALRAAVGPRYPLALTSFPYVDYHPRLPFSVFLGPGGAQANLPQVYWKDIGDPVAVSLAHTMRLNRVYNRPIAPIGQLYQKPAAAEVMSFRALSAAYGAPSVSWWEWSAAPDALWAALQAPFAAAAPGTVADPGWPLLSRGAKGDLVRRVQSLLAGTGAPLRVSGTLNAATVATIAAYQAAHGLPPTGSVDASTWESLLRRPITPAPSATPAPPPSGGIAPDVTS